MLEHNQKNIADFVAIESQFGGLKKRVGQMAQQLILLKEMLEKHGVIPPGEFDEKIREEIKQSATRSVKLKGKAIVTYYGFGEEGVN
jgi:hypothetical protein